MLFLCMCVPVVLLCPQNINPSFSFFLALYLSCRKIDELFNLSFLENVQEGEWSINEATEKFKSSNSEHYWKLAFNEGVNPNESILQGRYKERMHGEIGYVSRYDFTFLTPCLHQVRCKVSFDVDYFILLFTQSKKYTANN